MNVFFSLFFLAFLSRQIIWTSSRVSFSSLVSPSLPPSLVFLPSFLPFLFLAKRLSLSFSFSALTDAYPLALPGHTPSTHHAHMHRQTQLQTHAHTYTHTQSYAYTVRLVAQAHSNSHRSAASCLRLSLPLLAPGASCLQPSAQARNGQSLPCTAIARTHTHTQSERE